MAKFLNNALLLTFILCAFHTFLSAEEYTLHRSRTHVHQKLISPNQNIIETSVEQENITVEYPDFMSTEKQGTLTWVFQDGISVGQNPNTNSLNYDPENQIFAWDCGSPEITLKSFSIAPCYGDPCTLHRGQQITLTALFAAKTRATKLSCDILAHWGPITKHIGCPQWDACYSPGIRCPLEVGKDYTFVAKKSIASNVPTFLTYYIQGSLRDQDGKPFLCIATHAKIRE